MLAAGLLAAASAAAQPAGMGGGMMGVGGGRSHRPPIRGDITQLTAPAPSAIDIPRPNANASTSKAHRGLARTWRKGLTAVNSGT